MRTPDTNSDDAEVVALSALAWTLGDDGRAQRLLALTGMTPEGLRSGLADTAFLTAALAFLEAHEPDLIACAEHLGLPPQRLVEARATLERSR